MKSNDIRTKRDLLVLPYNNYIFGVFVHKMYAEMLKLKLHWQILIALALAVLYGILLPNQVQYVSWMGTIFLNALKMVIVPLIFTSIASGMLGMGDGKNLGRLGLKTILYYMSTSLLAIVTGLVLVNLIKPGIGINLGEVVSEPLFEEGGKIPLADTLINIVPSNIFRAMVENQVLSIIFLGIIVGYFIPRLNKNYSTLLTDGVQGLFELFMKITMFIIKFAPLGIFGLVAVTISEQSDLGNLAVGLGSYFVTVLAALATHAFITLPLILWFVQGINPIRHFQNMSSTLLTAFSTSSSSATLPLTMESIEHGAGVSNKVTSFTLPLGATINMDGTALYECIAVMFIAQFYGIEMTFAQQVMIVFTALLASIGAAGIPMAGLVMMSVILSVVDLPLAGIALILPVDRPLDMFRTATNVWSDSCGATVVAKSEGEKLNY